ncbi:3'-5' exonuclease [Paenibacillus glucanolyticus]|uniref:3'-5' exonuclease n=1 Tax=Paenibacillus glucanolyticus TaxID=59843 RepID=UPI00096EA5FB|nr:3'-5' exonuclease [Paenibacillus glucanolyticus]OMF80954.1 DNA polymerase III subunit epsilon [Paenibacillus glucanolyticus]
MMEPVQSNGGFWRSLRSGNINSAIASMRGVQTAQQLAFIRSQMKDNRRPEVLGTPLDELEVVVFDLETTGFNHQLGDEILSFGAVRVIGEQVIEQESFHMIVNSGSPVPPFITELTGITQHMVDAAPPLMEGLHDFMAFVGGRVLVAHAAAHDRGFLNAALWKTSKVRLTHRLLDTMMLAQRLYPEQTDYSLDELLRNCSIPVEGRHHALSDARMTARLWADYIKEIQARGDATTLGDMYVYLSEA